MRAFEFEFGSQTVIVLESNNSDGVERAHRIAETWVGWPDTVDTTVPPPKLVRSLAVELGEVWTTGPQSVLEQLREIERENTVLELRHSDTHHLHRR